MGRGQVVRHRVLVPTFVGSNPTGPVFKFFSAGNPLLVFDFYGVIVDGMSEYWSSARQAFIDLLPKNIEKVYRPPTEIPDKFKSIRPWVHYGWEMVLLAAECSNMRSRLNLIELEAFSKNYSKECVLALQRWKWTPNQLQKALNQARRNAISNNPNQWFNSHKPFSAVVEHLQRLDNEKIEFAVLTTKSLEFTQKLLTSFNLKPELVFGHESGSKIDVLNQLIDKRIIRGFIEDRRTTLEKVLEDPKLKSIPCYLASWGYLKPQDRNNLPSGIKLLNLDILREPISKWS